MQTPAKIAVSIALAAMICPQAAQAAPPAAADLPALVPDEDLDKLRGGFVWSGLDINFGADIRTYVDGNLLLHTVLNWTDNGAETVQTAAPGLTAADADSLQNGVLANGNIRMKVGESPVFLINNGQTAIQHDTSGGIRNMLINTANGLNSVQEVEARLDLSGYEGFNASMTLDRIKGALDVASDQAAIGALLN